MLWFERIRILLELFRIKDSRTIALDQLLNMQGECWKGSVGTGESGLTSTSSSARSQSMRSGEMSRCVSSRSMMMNRLRSSNDRMSCFTAASLSCYRMQQGGIKTCFSALAETREMLLEAEGTYQVKSIPL